MAIAYIVGAHAASDEIATTSSIDTTGATLLVAVVSRANNSGTLTDNKSNTWTALTTRSAGGFSVFTTAYHCIGGTVGSGHTFTFTTSLQFPAICVLSFSGVSAVDGGDTGSNELFPVTSIQPGSLTPSQDNCLLVTGFGFDAAAGSTPSINGGFTLAEFQAFNPGFGTDTAYLIQTSAAAANPTWSWTNSIDAAATMFTFRATAASGTLSKVNNIALASVSHCQGIAKASLLNYNGLTF